MEFNPNGIPEELKARHQWVLWRLEQRDGKTTKVPYTPQGYRTSVTNPKYRGSFDVPYGVYLRNRDIYSGLGFVLTEQDPFFILDYDHVRNPVTGEFIPGILEEIIGLNTYAEISQSGTGAHVIGKGTIPGPKRRSGCREMYPDKRFFAITGNHIEGTPFTINEVSEQALREIYEKIDPPAQKSQNEVGEQDLEVLENLNSTNEDIIELCKNAVNGEKFSKLMKGNWEDYKSQSEADLAFCSLVAFHTKDPDQINRIFSSSGLYREKWDKEGYRVKTISKALEGADYIKDKSEVAKPEVVLKEPYIITEDRIYLNVLDRKGHHQFAYLGDNGRIEYSESVQIDGRTVYPLELPSSSNGKRLLTVGIPEKELIDRSLTMSAGELYELIVTHVNKYIDAPQEEIEMFINYVLATWFYKKLNTIPYLRFLGDTGKGKSRMLRVITDICFYLIIAGGGSSASGIMRFNQLWHGTLGIDEIDTVGGMEHDFIKYLNLGFESGNFFLKTNSSDFSKQEWFDPFCPKVLAMRKPFQDNATETRIISYTPRETTRQDIPIILPPEYYIEVKEIRALIAKFVLFNWTAVDVSKLSNFKDMEIEPRSKQLAIPLSIILQLLPDKEKNFKHYFLRRQGQVTKIRSESWEGMIFNYVYSLAVGNEKPIYGYENYLIGGKVAAITPTMVAKNLGLNSKTVSTALSSIGMTTESKTIKILDEDGITPISKKTRMYVVPNGGAWREMVQRYLEKDSESEEVRDVLPECPSVLKATKYME